MPVFRYHGYDTAGGEETGSLDVSNEQLAFDTLRARGIIVYDLAPASLSAKVPWYKRDIRLRGNQLPLDTQAQIAELLAALFAAHLPVSDVLRIATASSEHNDVKRFFERVAHRVSDGENFARAFDTENTLFSPLFVAFARVSDTTNMMPMLFKELAGFLRSESMVRQRIVSALIYPAILIAAAIVLILIVVFYLAPSLAPMFASLGKEPPASLSVLLALNANLRNFWFLYMGAAMGLILVSAATLALPSIKTTLNNMRRRLPLLGKLLDTVVLARMTRALQLLLMSGTSLSDALQISATVMGRGSPLEGAFIDAAKFVDRGDYAYKSLEVRTDLPAILVELFRAGELTNSLATTLGTVSTALNGQSERHIQRMLNLLTPAITLILGVGIGALIYTLMGTILEVNELAF